jgi:hypothetical protein
MSTATKNATHDRRLEKFFRNELLAVAHRYECEGRSLLAGNPDPQLASYYMPRPQTKLTKSDFEQGACRTPDELIEALADMWREQGYAELSRLAPQMGQFAERLKETQQETDEVSPFVYVMY